MQWESDRETIVACAVRTTHNPKRRAHSTRYRLNMPPFISLSSRHGYLPPLCCSRSHLLLYGQHLSSHQGVDRSAFLSGAQGGFEAGNGEASVRNRCLCIAARSHSLHLDIAAG